MAQNVSARTRHVESKQNNRALALVALGPTAELDGEGDSKLGELKHMSEAKFVRNIDTTTRPR